MSSRTYYDPFGCWMLLRAAGLTKLAADFAGRFVRENADYQTTPEQAAKVRQQRHIMMRRN